MPADGSVNNQAVAIRPATFQRTSAPFLPRPVPMIDPVATCVVDSEYPKWLDSRITAAEDDSAAMPCGDSISTRPLPSVRMTRQPPMYVPRLIARPQHRMTQNGAPAVLGTIC